MLKREESIKIISDRESQKRTGFRVLVVAAYEIAAYTMLELKSLRVRYDISNE